jgi:uncharacterized protein (TIGR03435 family)
LVFSQTKSEFEVASVKPIKTGNVIGPARVDTDGRRFTASNAPLMTLLQFAYRASDGRPLRFSDVRGLPEWANQARYDIEARADTNPGQLSTEEFRILVQNLLADRFQLKAHWENLQNVDVYYLVVAKDGLKIKQSADQTDPAEAGRPRGRVTTIAMPKANSILLTIAGTAVPLSPDVTSVLQSYAQRPVIDKSGLEGLYDLRLQFAMEASQSSLGGAAPGITASDPSGPSFFTAMQEQLGLRFESAKTAVEILIVDHVEQPSEN